MKEKIILSFFLTCVTNSQIFTIQNNIEIESKFLSFLSQHGKSYETKDEYNMRLRIF